MQYFRKTGGQHHHPHRHHALPLPTHIRVKPGQANPHVYHIDQVHAGHHAHGKDAAQTKHVHVHHRSWLHGLAVGIKRVFSFILFPILVGIAFGVTASAVGMLIGQLVVLLWMRYRRSSTSEATYERLGSDEKEGLPAYEEVESVDVKEETVVVV